MDEPRGFYAKLNTSDRERQIPYDFTYTWNLKKNKINDQAKLKQTHRYKEQTDSYWGGGGVEGLDGKGEGIKKYKWWSFRPRWRHR